jgi:hypothetical protein
MRSETGEPMEKLVAFLAELDVRTIHYDLASHREGAIMVKVAVPGELWEVEYFADGTVEIEIFRSVGMFEEEELVRLLSENSE